ncbi:probable C-terminal domain small phosphatase [Impatiens glandulifera]|uniref:probable C-terminal domain small phosphatase n=1 Tax=Impatiens glandulifera TaxID=253017 RepID=UPI001FB0662C|nr:probable C-terminal domain small phosphatase [Impatiens glandulifera]
MNSSLELFRSNRRTIFLDLDETLIHSKPDLPNHKYDFIVRPVIDGIKMEFYVAKRPFVDEFLETLSEKFELVIFTAGVEEYASLVIEMLDRKGTITHRLYRDSCRLIEGKYVKDLESFGRDLSRSVIVDDNLNSYCFQPENGIPIAPFTGGEVGDGELLRLIDFFNNRVECYVDMRDAVKLYLHNRER